jgi:hypothetical protein
MEIAPDPSTEYCWFRVIREQREQSALKRSMQGEIPQTHCRLSGPANGFANSGGQGEHDGCRPIGYLYGAFAPPGEGFLQSVNQSGIFMGRQSGADAGGWVRATANSSRRKGMGFFRCRAANLHLQQSGGIAGGDCCRPPSISTIARIYKAKHRIVAANE